MSDARKVLASSMLAALSADRFKLFKEAELIALSIPYDLRRSTQDKVLKFRATRPFDPRLMPRMTPAAYWYLDHVEMAQRESRFAYNQLIKLKPEVLALKERAATRSPFDKPPSEKELEKLRLWGFHQEMIIMYHDSCGAYWYQMNETEKLWFRDLPPVTRWAGDFPLEAPAPHRFYPTEETPERQRQMHLLKWVIADCE